jgi:transposase
MSAEDEKKFLAAFQRVADSASMPVINEIKAALEKQLGRTVHKTTVCRLLQQHGWRKAAPRPKHPKQNKEAVEAFKKGASPTG